MDIAIIVAMTPQGLIGKDNQIPWHLPADLQRFKKITMSHPIIMGRKTFESLPGLLPGRQHIVLTRNSDYEAEGCIVVTNWAQIEILVNGQAFVIGGADIYKYALPIAKHLYTTIVHAELEGDTYFPAWNKEEWQEVEREFRGKDNKNKFDVDNIQYIRIT
ncbi:MAG: dihydrofolate reductase [Gammaproteobacteria bacterium]|nr:dihydrofolate reductase [Gammaproteobacteria bacterium]